MNLSKIAAIFTILFSLVVFAAPVPQEDLDKVNMFIAQLIAQSGDQDDVTAKITSAEREKNGKISALNFEGEFEKSIKAEGGIDLSEKNVDVRFMISGNLKKEMQSPDFPAMLQSMAMLAQKYVEAINKLGYYKATFSFNMTNEKATAEFKMIPVSEEAVSINVIEASLELDLKTGDATGIFTADFNSTAQAVEAAQTALTNIFESLLKGQEPSEDDFDAIGKIIEDMLKELSDQLK